MRKITVKVISSWPHCSQIVTGFLLLAENSRGQYQVTLENCIDSDQINPQNMAVVMAEYCGRKLVYDVMDGYQNKEGITRLLGQCDFYFKRSFSTTKNQEFLEAAGKMHPLGMNYMVVCKNNPYEKGDLKSRLQRLRGDKPLSYFTCENIQSPVIYREGPMNVIFFTRLWEGEDEINKTRIDIIRKLKEKFAGQFQGGLHNTKLARTMAPDLIIPKRITERGNYLSMVRESDICIGTTGLFNSIGWKTAEYTAMGKAIVCEALEYELPGDFQDGKNYLSFSDADGCIRAVERLIHNPEYTYQMKLNNLIYYYQYLKPDRMIKRTLDLVDSMDSEKFM